MTHALVGRYANFGIMEYYQDFALQTTLKLLLQVLINCGIQDILVIVVCNIIRLWMKKYQKLSMAYYRFLEVYSSEQLMHQQQCDSSLFSFMVNSFGEGTPFYMMI